MWLFTIESLFKGDDAVVVNDVLGLGASVGSLAATFSFLGELLSWPKVVPTFTG